MAVYTEISNEKFEALLLEYGLGSFKQATGIVGGVTNTNYLLETDSNKYIATTFENGVVPDDIPFFLSLMEHLSQKGINCPLPVHCSNGEFIKYVEGKPFTIVSFLDGESNEKPSLSHCSQLGATLALLHKSAQDFSMNRENSKTFHHLWDYAFDKIKDKVDDINHQMLQNLEDAYEYLNDNWPINLPSGIIHGDLFPDNVFFNDEDKLSGIIDLYMACDDFLAYDIAICINSWCFSDGEFDPEKSREIIESYEKIRELTDEEKESIKILTVASSLRTLLSRLYDWLYPIEGADVVAHDPIEMQKILQFNMNVKDSSVYGV